jgi:hypothetical protein
MNLNSKRVCHFCQTDQYSGKYSEHLKKKHLEIVKAREVIKNLTRSMEAEELKKVIEFLNELGKNREDIK